jgi:hypothetical protein
VDLFHREERPRRRDSLNQTTYYSLLYVICKPNKKSVVIDEKSTVMSVAMKR